MTATVLLILRGLEGIAAMLYEHVIRPALFCLDAERAHGLTMSMMSAAQALGFGRLFMKSIPEDPVEVMGLKFPNRLGLAAGLDKNGEAVDAFGALGFGFIETGTVTPSAQPGNPKPRLFRLVSEQSIINRMGFNNHGAENLVKNVTGRRYKGILGINIGRNNTTPLEKAGDDYAACLRTVYDSADYVTVNVSCPNTPGLVKLQDAGSLKPLLTKILTERDTLAAEKGRKVPVAVKISPDLQKDALLAAADVIAECGADAVIATNTTTSRDSVSGNPLSSENGGLSGAALRDKSTEAIGILNGHLQKKIPIIGVGGVFSGADAKEKIEAGASLVEIFSSLIYRGPGIVKKILRELK